MSGQKQAKKILITANQISAKLALDREKSAGKAQKQNFKFEFSAGGVVFKRENHQIFWLVSKHSGYHKWVLPKGIIEKNEKAAQAALREVAEETGVKAKIIAKIPESEFYVYHEKGKKIFKRVVYFLMEYLSGQTKNHSWEMEKVKWLPFEKALAKLEFKGAKEVLVKAKRVLEEKEKQPSLL